MTVNDHESLSNELVTMLITLNNRLKSGDYKGTDLSLAYQTWKEAFEYPDKDTNHAFNEAVNDLRDTLRATYRKVTQDPDSPAAYMRVCLNFWRDDVLLGSVQKAKVDLSDVDLMLDWSDDETKGFDINRESGLIH